MSILGKKNEFLKYTKAELKKMREECVAKLNASVNEYRESDRMASIVKDGGSFGLRSMTRLSTDRRFWQNRLDAIDAALKEKESPKAIAKKYKEAEAEEIINIDIDPKAAERLQEIRMKRFEWLCKLAGFSNDKKLSKAEIAVLEQLISTTETEMNRLAENYAKILGIIKYAAANVRKPIPNYERDIDDYSQLVALGELAVANRLKELEFFKNRDEKNLNMGTKSPKTPRTSSKGMRRKDEHLESLINTKDYGVGGLGE